MSLLPLYRKNPKISNRYAKFPQDFEIVGETIIDERFASDPHVGGTRWFLRTPKRSRMRYAFHGRTHGGIICLHQVAWGIAVGIPGQGMEIDHINRNGLDNRLENLRLVTRGQQTRNRDAQRNCASGYKGVAPGRHSKDRWQAYVTGEHRRKICLGTYRTREEAAYAHNVAASELYGAFSALNPIPAYSVPIDRLEEILRETLQRIR